MVIPPFATPKKFIHALTPKVDGNSLWFIFSKDLLLVSNSKNLPNECSLPLQSSLYMGTLENHHLFGGEVEKGTSTPQGWIWTDLRELYGVLNEEQYALAGQALQLIDWNRSHKYCGCCGSETFQRKEERCLECKSCGHLAYPKLAPVVMALVQKENKILLARGSHFPERMYSVLAGFVSPGETLEQCVIREVFEEVGLKVKNLRYFGSQPWPFSKSLMMAFICDWEEGEICIDPLEIEDAKWFDYENLPEIPSTLSLARLVIDSNIH